MRGWEIGAHPDLQEDDDVFIILDSRNGFEDREDNGQEDDDKWRNWSMDDPDPELEHPDERDEDLECASRFFFWFQEMHRSVITNILLLDTFVRGDTIIHLNYRILTDIVLVCLQ